MRGMLAIGIFTASLMLGCRKPPPAASTIPAAEPQTADVSPRDKLCAQLAPAITDCALADKPADAPPMDPRELERTAAEHTKSVFYACRREVPESNLPKLAAWQGCLAEHQGGGACGALEDCLGAAN